MMWTGWVKLYRVLVYSNLLIALAAVAQCLLTYVVLDKSPNLHIVIIEGAATLLLYNASLWLSKPKFPQASPYPRTRWVFSHQIVFWVNSILAGGLLLFSLLFVHSYTLLFLGFIGVISLAYNLPVFKFGGHMGGLRQVPGLKLFHIAFVWSLSSVGLPVVELWAGGQPIDWAVANYLGVLKVLFLLICTLPFDIRDVEQDSYYHLKTIPQMIGKERAKTLCYLFLLTHVLFIVVAPYSVGIKMGLIVTSGLTGLLLKYHLFRGRKNFHDVYLLDTALVVQYGIVLGFVQVL